MWWHLQTGLSKTRWIRGLTNICAATTDLWQRVAVDGAVSHPAVKASGTRIGRAHLHLVVAPGRVKKGILLTIFHSVPDVGMVPWQGRRSCVTTVLLQYRELLDLSAAG